MANFNKLTPFGLRCKHAMLDLNIMPSELARMVHEDTGMYCDASYLTRIFYGERNAPKIKESICKILEIKEG